MAAAAEDKPSPMQLSTDELVEMSLDDIIKKTSKVNLKNRRKRPERKGPKERTGIPVKKAGENAKKSANKAKKSRDAAFSKGRGIEVTGGGDGGSGEGAKGRRRKGSPRGGGVQQQQQGGGIKVQINKAAVGGKGGGQGNKSVTGTLNLPKDFKLPPGTTLKVSIQTGNKATATAVKSPPGNNSNNSQQKKGQQQQQQQGGLQKIKVLRKKGRLNPKTASTEAMQGAGKQARRIVLAQQGRNKRDRAFDAARGIQLTSGGGGNSTNKSKGGRGGGAGKSRGRGMGQGRTRKVVVRGKQK